MDAFRGVKFTRVDKYVSTTISRLDDRLIYNTADTIEARVLARPGSNITTVSSVDFYLNGKLHSTERWGYVSKSIDIEEPGTYDIVMKGFSTNGFPDIDFLAFASPQGTDPVEYGHSTAIAPVLVNSTQAGITFDMHGRQYPSGTHLPQGIYVRDKKKIIVR